jgi:hypothetical protein
MFGWFRPTSPCDSSVRNVLTTGPRQPGDGFRRAEGALADDPHWDAIMEEIYLERKTDTRSNALE